VGYLRFARHLLASNQLGGPWISVSKVLQACAARAPEFDDAGRTQLADAARRTRTSMTAEREYLELWGVADTARSFGGLLSDGERAQVPAALHGLLRDGFLRARRGGSRFWVERYWADFDTAVRDLLELHTVPDARLESTVQDIEKKLSGTLNPINLDPPSFHYVANDLGHRRRVVLDLEALERLRPP
jgi:hypothetical protein